MHGRRRLGRIPTSDGLCEIIVETPLQGLLSFFSGVIITFDTATSGPYTDGMDIHLNPDLQAKLAKLAAQRGREPEILVQEAIERLVDYDGWFVAEVEKGLAQIERGEVITHEEVGARLDKLLSDKHSRA